MKKTARALLQAVDEADSTLSISIVTDREIQVLNRDHRGKDKATDVLSFPLHPGESPERMLGDVVISVETARRQAEAYDAALQDEVNRLLIHGILHVLGHDHEEASERARMEAEERRLAAAIDMVWPYD
ncbi:MAG: rRNA maturation RNase YbeY [Candidatus Eremiobacteraeota bacterium]|nr:rRNA maturation RNase YbeY [Candidatus Eremiobacteraeota bacterium]